MSERFEFLSSKVALVAAIAAVILVVMAMPNNEASAAQGSADPWSGATQPADLEAIATDIVVGEVVSTQSIDTGSLVHTVADIAVIVAEKGSLGGTVQVEVAGGAATNGTQLVVSHNPVLETGQNVRLLLVEATSEERAAIGADVYSIVGAIDGVELVLGSGQVLSQAQAIGDFVDLGRRQPSFPQTYQLANQIPPGSTFEAAIFGGIADWEGLACSDVLFSFGGYSAKVPGNLDGVNSVGAVIPTSPADTWIGLTSSWVDTSTGIVVEWDVSYNVRDHGFSVGGTPTTFDLQTVTRHEFGHVLGLGHTLQTSEVMFPTGSPNQVIPLGSGDISGAATLYPATPFVDVPSGVFYQLPTTWLFVQGITTGTTATTFSPNATVSRAQMATFLHRNAGSPPVGGSSGFVDVPPNAYFADAVTWLVQQGITTGTSSTTYSPGAPVTRGQMATFLHRAAGTPLPAGSSSFTDVPSGVFYATAVDWLSGAGITTGTTPTTFSPSALVNRGQMATFLYRFNGTPSC